MRFFVVVKQWLPQGMIWKESIAEEFSTFFHADIAAKELRCHSREAYVISVPSVKDLENGAKP